MQTLVMEVDAPSTAARSGVTCVIVTYNGAGHIGACLASLLADGVAPRDVVVVDNGSTDETVELVHRAYPDARVIELARNVGYGGGANIGAAFGAGPYVVVLNQDVVVAPGCVERLVAALQAAPSALLANPKVLLACAPDRINTCGNRSHYTGITVCRGYGEPATAYTDVEVIGAVSGVLLAARREAFDVLGGFDAGLFMYLEDTDLSLRTILAGYDCLLVPDAVIYHDFAPRFAPEKLFWLERNRLAMLLKAYRWRTLAALVPALLLTEGIVLGYSVLRGPTAVGAKLRSYAWVVGHLPSIMRWRRAAQARRRVSDLTLLARTVPDLDMEELRHPLGELAMRLVNPMFLAWLRVVRAAAA